jgi:hypothetical protein
VRDRCRAELYARAAVSPISFLANGASSGINQWRDVPREWGQGGEGFGRRFGYRAARDATGKGIEFAVSALRSEDPRYIPCPERSFKRRVRYLIIHTYMVRNGRGQDTFAVSRLAGAYGSAFIAKAWTPPSQSSIGSAVVRGTWTMVFYMAGTAFQEFWPQIQSKLFHKRKH